MPTPVAAVPAPVAAPPKPVVPANGAAKGAPQPPAPPGRPDPKAGAQAAPEVDADPIIWEGKVDGQLRRVKKSEADRYLSKGAYADKATQEAKEAIKAARAAQARLEATEKARVEKAKADLDAHLRELGVDPDEYAKSKLERKVAEGRMTQAERDKLALEDENKRLKAEQAKKDEERAAERQKALTTHLQRRVEHELGAAAKRAGLTPDSELFFAVYQSFEEAYELGLLPIDANGLQPHHADRIVEDAQARLDGAQKSLRENALKLKGPALLDFVGKEAVDAIVAARLEQIREAKGIAAKPPAAPPPAPAQKPSQYVSPAEFESRMKKLGGRG